MKKEPNIIPVGSRCLVKPFIAADKTESGLVLNNESNVSAAPVRGTVLKAGDKSKFKKGQDLLYRRYSMDSLKMITPKGEETVYFVDDEDVLGYYR